MKELLFAVGIILMRSLAVPNGDHQGRLHALTAKAAPAFPHLTQSNHPV